MPIIYSIFTGYRIYCNNTLYTEVATSTTNLSIPAYTGGFYIWTVRSVGEVSEGVDSNPVYCYTYTTPSAPTVIIVDPSSGLSGNTTILSWSGAKDGYYNEITGYDIYSSTSTTGTKTKVATVADD